MSSCISPITAGSPIFRIGGYHDTLLFAGHEPAELLLWLDRISEEPSVCRRWFSRGVIAVLVAERHGDIPSGGAASR
jgi:hypothetical protein